MASRFGKSTRALSGEAWKFLLTLASFVVLLAGCENTCFSFSSNPPAGTISIKASDAKPSCMFTRADANVRVLARPVSPCSFCPSSTRIAHIFVSPRGIEVHENVAADDASSDWQELMPQLVSQPLQFDLASSAARREARLPLGAAVTIPADTYRQLRLRFVPNEPPAKDPVPQNNACGPAGFNCVVSEDGQSYPLLFDDSKPELHLTVGTTAGGPLLILPDMEFNLVIEFNVAWSLSSVAGEGLLPVLSGRASVERRSVERFENGALDAAP